MDPSSVLLALVASAAIFTVQGKAAEANHGVACGDVMVGGDHQLTGNLACPGPAVFGLQLRLTQTPCLGLGELRGRRQDLYRCNRIGMLCPTTIQSGAPTPWRSNGSTTGTTHTHSYDSALVWL